MRLLSNNSRFILLNNPKVTNGENFRVQKAKDGNWNVVAENGEIISEGFFTRQEAREFAENEMGLPIRNVLEKAEKQMCISSKENKHKKSTRFYRLDGKCSLCGYFAMDQSDRCYNCNSK